MNSITVVGFCLSAVIGCIYGYILRGKEIKEAQKYTKAPEMPEELPDCNE